MEKSLKALSSGMCWIQALEQGGRQRRGSQQGFHSWCKAAHEAIFRMKEAGVKGKPRGKFFSKTFGKGLSGVWCKEELLQQMGCLMVTVPGVVPQNIASMA